MMMLKLIIASCILIWEADCQRAYNSYQANVPDIGSIIFENIRSFIPQFGYDPYGGRDNSFSPTNYNNNEQVYENNGLGTEKRALTEQPNIQTQQPIYQGEPQQQQATYQHNLQSQQVYQPNQQSQVQSYQQMLQKQQQSLQHQQQENFQQSWQQQQQPNFQQNLQPQKQQSSQQNLQQQKQPSYQQNLQPQKQTSFQQNLQPQKQTSFQQNLQPQKQPSYQQNLQPQKQPSYQQNLQAQKQTSFQPNLQPQKLTSFQQNFQPQKQPSYQQNLQQQTQTSYQQNLQAQQQSYQPEVQPNGQNIQSQPQDYEQNLQLQQQGYQQNYQQSTQPQNYNIRPINTLTTSNEGILSRFGAEDTGKTSQNANYNNETFAITRFGLKLLKGINSPGNVVVSPYSIAMLLALVQQGAHGYTQQEITQALQLKPETSADLYKKLTAFFKKRGSINVLKVANFVALKNTFNVDRNFKSNAIHNFGSEVYPTNFNNPYQSVQMINRWVADKTGQKINNLLAPDALQPDTLAVLVNAIYFKGTWQIKFRPELTETKDFTLIDGSIKPVPFMQARRLFQTDIDLAIKSQVLLLPFEGDQYSMMFILPLEGTDVNYVMSSLTEPQLYSYQNMSPKEVKLEIPRFTVQQDSDITRLLNDLNVWSMFGNNADLSGIGTENGVPTRISSGVHSAVLSIDENGGSAAAATAYSVVALSYDDPTTSFTANRPFIAILWDNQLRMPLFMAKIEDPSA